MLTGEPPPGWGGLNLQNVHLFLVVYKGTVSIISSEPLFKESTVRFKTVHIKVLSDQVRVGYPCFCFVLFFTRLFSFVVSIQK